MLNQKIVIGHPDSFHSAKRIMDDWIKQSREVEKFPFVIESRMHTPGIDEAVVVAFNKGDRQAGRTIMSSPLLTENYFIPSDPSQPTIVTQPLILGFHSEDGFFQHDLEHTMFGVVGTNEALEGVVAGTSNLASKAFGFKKHSNTVSSLNNEALRLQHQIEHSDPSRMMPFQEQYEALNHFVTKRLGDFENTGFYNANKFRMTQKFEYLSPNSQNIFVHRSSPEETGLKIRLIQSAMTEARVNGLSWFTDLFHPEKWKPEKLLPH
jgi:hypothetical protein